MWIIRILLINLVLSLLPPFISGTMRAQEYLDLREIAREELEYTKGIYMKEMPLLESPVPISVYSREYLERFGFRNLREFLDFMPSYYLVPGIGELAITYRGFRSMTSASVLVLEDEARIVTPDYESFPVNRAYTLQDISRIELFHGAGGSIYGSGAFSGIVSLERAHLPGEKRLDFSLGTNDQKGLSFSFHGENHYLFVRTYKEDSPLKDYGRSYETDQTNSLVFRYIWGGGDLSLHYFKEKTYHSLTLDGAKVDNNLLKYVDDLLNVEFLNFNLRKYYVFSNYKLVLNPYFTKAKVDSPFFTRITPFPAYTIDISPLRFGLNFYLLFPFLGGDLLSGGEIQYKYLKDYKLTFVLPMSSQFIRFSHVFRSDEDLLYALYFSYVYNFKNFGLHLGTRFEKHEDYRGALTNRLGIAYRIHPNLSFLISYTEGYNTPSHFHNEEGQIFWGKTPIYSFSRLKPEKERSFQLSLLYQRGREAYFRNTIYLQEQRERIWHDPLRIAERNLPPYKVWGFESELIRNFGEHLLFVNLSSLRVAEGKDIPYIVEGKYIAGIPEFMLKGGVSLRLPFAREVYLSPLIRLIGSAKDKDGKRISGYTVTDLNLLLKPVKRLEINFRIDNLFDKTHFRAGTISAIPFGGRRVSLDLRFSF